MKPWKWKIALSVSLVGLSAALYVLHFSIFRDARHIFFYLLSDIAFIPIDVLLVVLVLHGIITGHEKQLLLKKLNMVFGAFFSEVGTDLLRTFIHFDRDVAELKKKLSIHKEWSQKDFINLRARIRKHEISVDAQKGDLGHLRALLIAKREFLLRLLENPNLLEHEDFTNLLWAVFHLGEELAARPSVAGLPPTDYEHLAGDIKRAYSLLLGEWVAYIWHLHKEYPFLFSLAVRTNPFNTEASVIVK